MEPKYKVVPKSWRTLVNKRYGYTARRRRVSKKQIIHDLLAGKTVLIEQYLTPLERKNVSTTMYRAAAAYNKQMYIYHFDDIDNDVYKGLLCWMEDKFPVPEIVLLAG